MAPRIPPKTHSVRSTTGFALDRVETGRIERPGSQKIHLDRLLPAPRNNLTASGGTASVRPRTKFDAEMLARLGRSAPPRIRNLREFQQLLEMTMRKPSRTTQMVSGALELRAVRLGSGGQPIYDAIYRAPLLNLCGSGFSDFRPSQHHVVDAEVETYLDHFRSTGTMQFVEPIKAALTPDGGVAILDGHHRLVAALASGIPVRLTLNSDPEPHSAVATDWGNIAAIDSSHAAYKPPEDDEDSDAE
jgi:hypothetical protein